MKDTKRKIIEKALELFNQEGSGQVTVRDIAAALGISHGNLCYHYLNTDAIIIRLYEELVEELDVTIVEAMEHMKAQAITLTWMFETSQQTFSIFYKYRFFMLEFVPIMRRIDIVRQHYQGLQHQRRLQFRQVFGLLQDHGYLIEEPFPGSFTLLIELMMLTGDFWLSEAEITHSGDSQEKIRYYSQVFNHLFVPYFTAKGLFEYREYYNL